MKNFLILGLALISFTVNAQDSAIEHVILIGVDGMGANYLSKAEHIPHMKKMMDNGSYTMHARCVRPSSSAVNWASMTMGATPSLTGYTKWDSQTPEIPSRETGNYDMFPSIFEILRDQNADAQIDVFYTWSGIGYLFPKKAVDREENTEDDSLTVEKAVEAIQTDQPNLLFLHFDDVDAAGHGQGWGTDAYYQAIQKMDERIGKIKNTVEDEELMKNTVILVTADHGGREKDHGGKSIQEMEIPWIAYGAHIKENQNLDHTSIMTFDTASTIAHLLDLEQPQVWTGRPVKAALKD